MAVRWCSATCASSGVVTPSSWPSDARDAACRCSRSSAVARDASARSWRARTPAARWARSASCTRSACAAAAASSASRSRRAAAWVACSAASSVPAARAAAAAVSAAAAACARVDWSADAAEAASVSPVTQASRQEGSAAQSSGAPSSPTSLTRLTRSATVPRWVVGGAPQLDAALAQPALGAVESLRPEDLLEQGVALLGPRSEEGLEPPLREHGDLAELRERHADETGDQVSGLVEAGAERVPEVLAVVGGAALGDHDAGLLGGGAGAALLRPGPRGRAVDAEPSAGQGRLEHHPWSDVVGGVVGAQALGDGAVTGDVAVEREADRVEDAGLAGSRRPAEEEEPGVGEGVEVDRDRIGERAEADDLELVQPHEAPRAVRGAEARGAPTSTSWSGSWQQASMASRSRAASPGVASDATHVADEVERDGVVARAGRGPRRGAGVDGRASGTGGPACGGSVGAAAPWRATGGGRRSG